MADVVASVPMNEIQIGDRGEIIIISRELARDISDLLRNTDTIACTVVVQPGRDVIESGSGGERSLVPRDHVSADPDTGHVTIFDHDLNRIVYNGKEGGLVGRTYFRISFAAAPPSA